MKNNNLTGSGWRIFPQRVFAFVMDSLLFISVFSGLIRIFNLFMPGHDVREDPMQLYTEKDFRVFVATVCASMILLAIYMLVSYNSKRGQTLGHRVARIRIQQRHGLAIQELSVFRILIVAWLRLLLIVVPGPMIAFFGGGMFGSLFFLIWAVILVLPFPITKTGSSLWEILGGYKFVSYKADVST